MSTLHDDLVTLTDSQPLQPGDRLAQVTRKAGRIRRTRAAVAVAAVVAVAVPVGAVLTQSPTHDAVPASSIDSWPDRSQQADRARANGAVQQWHLFNPDEPTGKVHWLYRGTVDVPDGTKAYVAIWREAGRVLTSYVNPEAVDAHGVPDGGFQPDADTNTTPWIVYSAKDTGSRALGLYLPYDQSLPDNKGAVLVLTNPAARTLHWDATPLAAAPVGQGGRLDRGELTGHDGVFLGDTGSTVGPLTVTTADQKPLLRAEHLTIRNQDLLRPDLSDLPSALVQHLGGAGEFNSSATPDDSSPTYASDPVKHAALYVRCYGSGYLDVVVGQADSLAGRAACDGQLHEVFRDRTLSRSDTVGLRSGGTGTQVWRFELGSYA